MASEYVEGALQTLRSEYLTTPNLRLTPGEAAEMLDLDRTAAFALLQALEDSAFLKLLHDGRFGLATGRPQTRHPTRPRHRGRT